MSQGEEMGRDAALHAERLLDMLPGGFPQPHSKLRSRTWRRAAQLFAAREGQVKLRELCDACSVSHRTAWRIRQALRDSAQTLREMPRHDRSLPLTRVRHYRGEAR